MFPGPKCSAFMAAISLWGIIFMAIVGALFMNKSVGLIEDIPGEKDEDIKACYDKYSSDSTGVLCWNDRVAKIHKSYEQNAKNCWIAAVAFLVTFVLTLGKFCIAIR